MTRCPVWLLAVALAMGLFGCTCCDSATNADAAADETARVSDEDQVEVSPFPARGLGGEWVVRPPLSSKPTGLLIEPSDAVKIGYSVQWATTIDLPEGGKPAFISVLGDLVVVVEHPSNVVHGISAKSGKQLWHTALGGPYDHLFAPLRVDDGVFVNSEKHMYRLRADDGRMTERAELRAAVGTGPAMVGEFAIFGGSDGLVFGHDTRVAYAKWTYKMPGQVLATPQAQAAQVFVACTDGQYAMYAGRTGDQLYRGRTFARITAVPAVTAQGVWIACEDHSLYALHRATGEDRWIFRYTAPLTQSPVVLQNVVYQPLPSGELIALKATDGTPLWRIKTDDKLVSQDSRALVFNAGNRLALRDPRTGKPLMEAKVAETLEKVVASEDQSLLLVSPSGRLLKMSPTK